MLRLNSVLLRPQPLLSMKADFSWERRTITPDLTSYQKKNDTKSTSMLLFNGRSRRDSRLLSERTQCLDLFAFLEKRGLRRLKGAQSFSV